MRSSSTISPSAPGWHFRWRVHDFADIVLGHPSALPADDELYGFPPAWPAAFHPRPAEVEELRALCARVSANFTVEWNETARALDPEARLSTSAFSEHGPRVLYNYPQQLAGATAVSGAVFLGSTRREEPADPQADEWLADAAPFVYVSFGSFLSVRDDVLRRVCDALRAAGARAAIATGSTPPAALGPLPDDWLVRIAPPAGPDAGRRRRGRHPRWQQLGDRGARRRSSAAGAALLHRPVRGRRSHRSRPARRGARTRTKPLSAELREALETLLDRSAIDEDLLARVVADQRAESGPGPRLSLADERRHRERIAGGVAVALHQCRVRVVLRARPRLGMVVQGVDATLMTLRWGSEHRRVGEVPRGILIAPARGSGDPVPRAVPRRVAS